jgi:transcriptional regulator with XRE-family HTH domain
MADLKDVVARNLLRLRQAKGWTQEELADRVGLSVRYVGQFADALAIDASELVRSSGDKTP